MVDQTADQRESTLNEVDSINPWVGQVMRDSQSRGSEEYREWRKQFDVDNPDAPTDAEVNYQLMHEQNKMPDPKGEGFGFIPTEFYRSFVDRNFTKPLSRYSTKTKDNQFDDWEARVLAQGVRGAYQTTVGRVQAQFGAYAKHLIDLTAQDEFPEYELRGYDDLIAGELEANWAPFKGKVTDPDRTVGAALEMLTGEMSKFAIPMMAGTAAFGTSNAIKMAQGKSAFKRVMARMEDATAPNMIAGEFLYALNPESLQTLVKDTGEWLRDDFGMSGPFVDALIAADDTPLTKAIAGAAEGMVMFEALRTFAKGNISLAAPVLRKAKAFVSASMRELDTVQRAMVTSAAGFHGTASPYTDFSNAMRGSTTKSKSAKRAHWFVDDPETAGGYADYAAKDAPVQRLIEESQAAERAGEWDKSNKLMRDAEALEQSLIDEPAAGQNIRKVDLDGDYLVVDAEGQTWGQLDDGQLNKWLDEAQSEGKEGLQINNFSDEAAWGQDNPRTHWAIFDAKDIEKVK